MRIVFMGTPDFAVRILEAVHDSKHQVVGVVTVADKPAGRGQKLSESAVKQFAVANALPVLQPASLKDQAFLTTLSEWNADLFLVVAFRMLPKEVWKMPPKGTINLHASLLPQYRGAAPINWAIINGEKVTGVTTFMIDEKIDTGNLLLSATCSIGENQTAGELHDELAELGRECVINTLNQLESDTLFGIPQVQDADELKAAPKLFREDCKIDWSNGALAVHNQIRGLSPYPGAWTMVEKGGQLKTLKIFRSQLTDRVCDEKKSIWKVVDGQLMVSTSDYWLILTELQLEGSKRMSAADFLRGNNPQEIRWNP